TFPSSQFEIHFRRVRGLDVMWWWSRLLEEPEHGLGNGVGLGEHGGARLHKDVVARVLSGFVGHVHVLNARTGGREVFLADGELLGGEVHARLVGADGGPVAGELVDGRLDAGEGSGGRRGGGGQVDRDTQVNANYREAVAFRVDGHIELVAREKTDTVKILGGGAAHV